MMRTMKQLKRSMIAMFLVVCMICSNTLPAFADQAAASTMRLAKTEGTVSVTNKNGRDMGTKADMKLFNGYNLGTQQASYAWIGLDDSKLVKLDAISEAEIQKKGKELEILLNSGNLFFNVSESLKADETMNIRTSTMVTGIRGTSGWVKVLDSKRTQVYILEGRVECTVMDPITGQTKSIVLHSGQKAEFIVYDQTREGDKCDILVGNYREPEIDPFVAVELLADGVLYHKIQNATDFNMGEIIAHAEERLKVSEQNAEQKKLKIQSQMLTQPSSVKDPVFEGQGGSSQSETIHDSGTSGSGGSDTTTPEDTIELTMPVTAEELHGYLQTYNVILHPDPSGEQNMLLVDHLLTVPGSKSLNMDSGIDMRVEEGYELRIDGTLTMTGSVTNNGTITNTSMNTFNLGSGTIANLSGGVIENTGRIVASVLHNEGMFTNSGNVEAALEVSQGTVDITGGTISTTDTIAAVIMGSSSEDNYPEINVSGNAQIDGIAILENGGKLEVTGGTIFAADTEGATAALLVESLNANVTISDDAIIDGGKKIAVKADGGNILIDMTEESNVTIQAEDPDKLVTVPEASNDIGGVQVQKPDPYGEVGVITDSLTGNEHFICEMDEADNYILRNFSVDFYQALEWTKSGQVLCLKSDIESVGDDYWPMQPVDEGAEPIMVDLNGHVLGERIVVPADSETSSDIETSSSYKLTVFDSKGNGEISGSIQNEGTLVLDGVKITGSVTPIINHMGGTLDICNGTVIDVKLEDSDYIDGNVVIRVIPRGGNDTAVTSNSTVTLRKVTINSGYASALLFTADSSITIGEGTSLSSSSKWGTITYWCQSSEETPSIDFEGGSVTNTRDVDPGDVGPGAVNLYLNGSGCSIKDLTVTGTTLLSPNVTTCIRREDGKLDYTSWSATTSLMSLRLLPNPDEESEDTLIEATPSDADPAEDTDVEDTSSGSAGTATASNSVENDSTETGTDSNANGSGDPLTGSPAAIPLAAALLGIWMSMPREYKKRKFERNGKES